MVRGGGPGGVEEPAGTSGRDSEFDVDGNGSPTACCAAPVG